MNKPEFTYDPDKFVPNWLREHPLFLMASVLKLAKRQGIHYRKKYGADSEYPDLRLVHFAILSCLDQVGSMSQKGMSELLHADPSELVGLIDQLEAAGYVKRSQDLTDRRRYSLEVTSAGKAVLPHVHAKSTDFAETFLQALSATEQEELKRLLLKILTSMHDVAK